MNELLELDMHPFSVDVLPGVKLPLSCCVTDRL